MADDKLSINNMVELAMGLSMASLFSQAMTNAHNNTARMLDNSQAGAPPRYIFVIVNGTQRGPLTLGEITEMIRTGEVTPETYMWKQGMPAWKRASEIDDINPTFNTAPPAAPNTAQ